MLQMLSEEGRDRGEFDGWEGWKKCDAMTAEKKKRIQLQSIKVGVEGKKASKKEVNNRKQTG